MSSSFSTCDIGVLPTRRWSYFSGYPGLCLMYFVGGSLDFFHDFYQTLLNEFGAEKITFRTIQTNKNFLCELRLMIQTDEDIKKLQTFSSQHAFYLKFPIRHYRYSSSNSAFNFSLLSTFKEEFFYTRALAYLKRLTPILFHAQMALMNHSHQTLRVRLMKAQIETPYEIENALGVVVTIKQGGLSGLDEEKALKAMQSLLPSATLVPHSFIRYEQKLYHLIYFEVRKMRGGPFSFHELTSVRKHLPLSLQDRLVSHVENVYFPKNEEVISHEVVRLACALKSAQDCPQVVITFQDVKQSRIRFNVIIAHVVKKSGLLKNENVDDLERALSKILNYIPKHRAILGYIGVNYLKQGLVFDLEIENVFFLNHDGTTNLIGARGYVAKILEEVLGPFRDCNGGLLQKQNQQLETIKEKLAQHDLEAHPLLEHFFYGLNPASLQATLPVDMITKLFFLLLKQLTRNIDLDKKYIFEKNEEDGINLLVLKTKEKEVITLLQRQVAHYRSFEELIGSTVINSRGFFYFCFFEKDTRKNYSESLIKTLPPLQTVYNMVAPHSKRVFRLNFHHGFPLSLNPQIMGDFRTFIIYKALFEGLTRINAEGNVELAAAERVEISNCRTQYTFHLRNIQWSNGEKLIAYHFMFAWKKALCPYSGGRRVDIFFPILNAEQVKKGIMPPSKLGVYVKDSETLVIHLNRPSEYFLELLAHPHCSPLYGEYSEPNIFNGPFICSSIKNATKMRLIRNPFYWDAKEVKLDEIEISGLKDPEVGLKLFENGQLDYIGDPTSPLPLKIHDDFSIKQKLHRKLTWRTFYLYCNTSCFPLNNYKIRKALSWSIDRSQIISALHGEMAIAISPLPDCISLQNELKNPFNPCLASDLLEVGLQEAGITRDDFSRLTIILDNSEFFRKVGELLHQQWKEVLGVTIALEFLEWDQLYARFDHGRYQLGGMFQSPYYSDPFFYLKMFNDRSGLTNRSRWKNEVYDELIAKSMNLIDQNEYKEVLSQAEKILIEEAPVIPLFNQTYHFLLNKKINYFFISKFGYFDLKKISIGDINE